MKCAFKEIGVENITIHVNHRGIFNRFLNTLGVLDKSEDILRSVDKLAKVGKDEVFKELCEYTQDEEKSSKIIEYISSTGSFLEILDKIESLAGGKDKDSERMRLLK